jgi:hypothetical protein
MSNLSPSELQTWLEWAGARLVAMPSTSIGPRRLKVIWPEYSQDQFEVLDFRGNIPLRASAPSKEEIPIMDEILLLPNLCNYDIYRKLLHYRMLVHPISGRHLRSWRWLGRKLHCDHKTAMYKHEMALQDCAARISNEIVIRLQDLLSDSYLQLRPHTS